MAWSFADSFDLYAAPADAINGYWDVSGTAGAINIVAGRFAGSRAFSWSTSGANTVLVKSSSVNDAVHHLVVSYQQTAAISGTTLGLYLQLLDGATAQCSIVFKSNGDILLASGGPTGTVLATYTGAVTVASTWYAFEFEVKIDGSAGTFAVRKNGNSVNDFTATALNTRGGTANNYANKLQTSMNAAVSAQLLDDLFWQSGAAAGTWLGDIRCYARMPASDASVTFSRAPSPFSTIIGSGATTANNTNTVATYEIFTAGVNGTLGNVTISLAAGYTGNMKCALYNASGSSPTTVIVSATTLTNPVMGANTVTFPTAPALIKGSTYAIGFISDTTVTNGYTGSNTVRGQSATTYAAFPVANPTTAASVGPPVTVNITPTDNNSFVNEAQQDGLTSYVYDSNPGDADFYGVGSIASTPASVIATTTRAYMQKSDAGTRTAAVQLKSGATTVASPTLVLTTSGWLWAWRTDTLDPNTGAAWTPAAVNNAQVGPKVIA